MRARQSTAPAPPVTGADAAQKLRKLGLELASSRSENDALRSELDRLLAKPQDGKSEATETKKPTGQPVEAPTAGASHPPRELLVGLAERYRDALSRSTAGDERAADEAYEAVIRLVRSGPEAFPVLRDAYLATSDPRLRAVMIRAFGSTLGAEANEFVASQLQTETDPELRAELVAHAAHMVTPTTAPVFRDAFLQALASDSVPAEARTAALRGLRYVRGDLAVDRALLAAAGDPSEEVRLAAIEGLASRPALRSELQGMLTSDPSGRVREIGQCRLLLTESPP